MKTLRQLSLAVMLVLTPASLTSAGVMDTPLTTPPATPPAAPVTGQFDAGTNSSKAIADDAAGSALTEAAFGLLQSVLSVF